MATHYKWYPEKSEEIVPFNARYSFPSQANKAVKSTPRIPPKNGSTFTPGSVIRLEFPAQGYVNPLNTTMEFDVTLYSYASASSTFGQTVRFQNNIQSIFNRVRLLYGSTPLEDMINYNVIVRMLTEWTGTNTVGVIDQTSIREGIGGVILSAEGTNIADSVAYGLVNVRQAFIQGIDTTGFAAVTTTASVGTVTLNGNQTAQVTGGGGLTVVRGTASFSSSDGFAAVPNIYNAPGTPLGPNQYCCTRRYQINFALGLFTQAKLIPTKFMASQLAIEVTLENAAACIFSYYVSGGTATAQPTYTVTGVNLIPEVLEFDDSYDQVFMAELNVNGVPLKFSTWNTFQFSTAGSSIINAQVQERSRSVKALFAVQRSAPADVTTDSGALLFTSTLPTESGGVVTSNGGSLQTYQYRIGARYFPAAPVQCSLQLGTGINNGGAEAYTELEKALNIVGDYRLSTSLNSMRWAASPGVNLLRSTSFLPNLDFKHQITGYDGLSGLPLLKNVSVADVGAGCAFSGNYGSACFAMAINLETSNGVEISGLNAEEQSDISLLAQWAAPQATAGVIEIYSFVDAMVLLKPNNELLLIR